MDKKEIIRSISLTIAVLAICITALLIQKRWGHGGSVPEGKILVDESFLDSLRAVAEMSPDTIRMDSIIVRDTTIYVVKKVPTPIYIDSANNQRIYVDSLQMIDDGIDAWVKLKTRGYLEDIQWGYRPVYKTITEQIRIYEPYPVTVTQYTPQRGLYLQGGLGAGSGEFGFSLGLSWQQSNGLSYGAEMVQFDKRFYMVKLGYKIF